MKNKAVILSSIFLSTGLSFAGESEKNNFFSSIKNLFSLESPTSSNQQQEDASYPNLSTITWPEIQDTYSRYDKLWIWENGNNHKGIIVGGIYSLLHRGELNNSQLQEAKALAEKFGFSSLSARLSYLLDQPNDHHLILPREIIETILKDTDGLTTIMTLAQTNKSWNYQISTYPLEIDTHKKLLPKGSLKQICTTFPHTKSLVMQNFSTEEDVDFILPLEYLEKIMIGPFTVLPINYISKLPHAHYPHLKVLGIIDSNIKAEGALLIASSQGVQKVEELYLSGNFLGDKGLIFLAESKYLSALRIIDIQLNSICGPGIKALLESPNLPNLKEIRFTLVGNDSEKIEVRKECLELAKVRGIALLEDFITTTIK